MALIKRAGHRYNQHNTFFSTAVRPWAQNCIENVHQLKRVSQTPKCASCRQDPVQSNQDPLPVAYCVLIKRSKRSKKKSLVVFSNGEVGVKNVYIVYFYTCDGYDIFETHA